VTGRITIGRRFRGPVDSGNGGYACGLVAGLIGANPAEVTLRSPPPLDRELEGREVGGGGVTVHDGDTLVAEGRPLEALEVEVPPPVSPEEAEAARRASPLHDGHPYGECFVCGPDRAAGDGLRVISGPVEGRGDVVASPWEVGEELAGEDGLVAPEIVWAVLDCPSGNAIMLAPEFGVSMLGRLSARLDGPFEPGRTYVALGWPISREGRKFESGSAILTPDGEPVARARGTWIELRG
jgi:hypothetical protein